MCKSIICIIDLKNGGSGHGAWNKSDLFLQCLISALIKGNRYGKRINRFRKAL